jgi:hypothetical protein
MRFLAQSGVSSHAKGRQWWGVGRCCGRNPLQTVNWCVLPDERQAEGTRGDGRGV